MCFADNFTLALSPLILLRIPKDSITRIKNTIFTEKSKSNDAADESIILIIINLID